MIVMVLCKYLYPSVHYPCSSSCICILSCPKWCPSNVTGLFWLVGSGCLFAHTHTHNKHTHSHHSVQIHAPKHAKRPECISWTRATYTCPGSHPNQPQPPESWHWKTWCCWENWTGFCRLFSLGQRSCHHMIYWSCEAWPHLQFSPPPPGGDWGGLSMVLPGSLFEPKENLKCFSK